MCDLLLGAIEPVKELVVVMLYMYMYGVVIRAWRYKELESWCIMYITQWLHN